MKPARANVGALAVIAAIAFEGSQARAQMPPRAVLDSIERSALVLVTSETVDRIRLAQLSGDTTARPSLLLRSASSLTPRITAETRGVVVSPIAPQFLFVSNSALPFSQNYGSLWAGKGISSRTLTGFRLEGRKARLILAPELVVQENSDWPLRRSPYDQPHNVPSVPPEQSGGGYVFPFYVGTYPIDQPMRFGDKRIQRLDPGQSSLLISLGPVEAGVSNEHEWWGPGIRNAIVLSNNAPGFPHLLVRTARPLQTIFGRFEARWLVGGLVESRYFDTISTNNVRSLASIAATLQTAWDPNLTLGLARSVYATAGGWGPIPLRWLDVFRDTPPPDNRPLSVAAPAAGGSDQLISLFGRWVFPSDGFELYAEVGRTDLPRSLRDLVVAPNHTQGYTLGMQWARSAWHSGTFRIQSELTQLEASPTRRDRPIGSWYTSRNVVQGYTNRGEILGGSIGPGASSQWLAVDYVAPGWRAGVFGGRIRWNEDVHNATDFPVYVYYCNHDVSVYTGVRAAASTRLGAVSIDYSMQNRLNAFFQNDGGCPNVGPRLDIRNNTLTLGLSPFNRH